MNYKRYYLSRGEWIRVVLEFIFLDFLISYIFYDSYVAFFIMAAGLVPYIKYRKRDFIKKRQASLKEEFLELIGTVSGKMRGGMSAENAFMDSYKDMEKLYGQSSPICRELNQIILRLNRQEMLGMCLYDLGLRSGIEDIYDFAEVYSIAAAGSGRIRDVIEDTISMMHEKHDTESEIEVVLSAKRLEQKIMCIIPLVIILYLRLETRDFISVLYHNPFGITVMSVCLLIYIASIFLSQKITDIEV